MVKILKFRKFGSFSAKKSRNLPKGSHSSSMSSDIFVSESTTIIYLQKWGNYTSSEESFDPVMVTEMMLDLDDRIQKMALAIKKLTKLIEEKDTQIVVLMHLLELQSPLMESNTENTGSSRTKESEVQEYQ
ncbi:Uncharacterized protein Adt_27548 [Abeliophyllum distichum]|uniref:Uncharacterized protein n=1 Tax=Abeliophyllum distichum TaxID=126358 RepID=A0ABD1RU17_9LAMI